MTNVYSAAAATRACSDTPSMNPKRRSALMSVLRTLARGITVTVAVLALTGIAHAACLSDEVVEKLVAGYPTPPVTGIPANLSLDDAYCTQAKYVALLE